MAKKDNKISMPQTGAGLVTEHVIVATVILAILCFVLRYSA